MQCYRKFMAASLMIGSFFAQANPVVEEGITPEQAVEMAKEQGWFEGLNLSGENVASPQDVDVFLDNAKSQIQSITKKTLQMDEQVTRPSSATFMFVSLSMPRAALKDAFKNAADSGVTVYINGMFEGDKNIMETMARLDAMGKDLLIKPNVKFGPSWFKKYMIDSVPALVYDDDNIQVKMSGMTQLPFFKEKLAEATGNRDFGAYGTTYPVEELSLIEQIKKRMEKIDWEQKKQAATKNYWLKRPLFPLSRAVKDDVFFIDPTVTIKNDIVNKSGVTLARAGTTFNPIAQMPNAYLGLYIVDPTDPIQLSWLDDQKSKFDYRDQIIITRLDPTNGWDNLANLRKRYDREIYVLEQELITKFAIKALPSTVSIESNYIKVSEFYLRGQL